MAAAKRDTNTTYSLTVTLSQSDTDALLGDVDRENPAAALAQLARNLLEAVARGGITLSPQDVRRIQESNPQARVDGKAIIRGMDKAAGMDEGRRAFRILLDPVWCGYFDNLAAQQGITAEQLLTNAWDFIWGQGTVYQVPLNMAQRSFTLDDERAIAAHIGMRHWTGTDLVNWLRGAEPAAAA